MLNDTKLYAGDHRCGRLEETVDVPISLYKSLEGRYFVGQTEPLWIANGSNAWAGLFNPYNSTVNLFANVLTISNFSDQVITAEIWLNTELSECIGVSQKVSPANTVYQPKPVNKVSIVYAQETDEVPQCGVNIFERIVPPNTTLVSEEDGKFIIPPCGNYTIYLRSGSSQQSKVIVAFGWWEDPER